MPLDLHLGPTPGRMRRRVSPVSTVKSSAPLEPARSVPAFVTATEIALPTAIAAAV